jgi:putative mRNA 3-end processing factor
MNTPLLQVSASGLYCAEGDFYIDPWAPVKRAVITHAHADHARPGSATYLASTTCAPLLRQRLPGGANIRPLPFGEALYLNGVQLSLHPAGHHLGSAQIRVGLGGEVWVVSGDYKLELDSTCEPFELVPCHTFVTESTFGLPIYRWRPQAEIFTEINNWWRANQIMERTSILFGYALGKAQRLLAGIDPTIGPILVHGAVHRVVESYLASGIGLPDVLHADSGSARQYRGKALVVAPPSASASAGWLRKFGAHSVAFASGWMQIRGARRRRAAERGFVLSDHADWPGLLSTIAATGATRVFVTHGYTAVMARWLSDQGLEASALQTQYDGEYGAGSDPDSPATGDVRKQPIPDKLRPEEE